jgi:hypothetical protein
MATRGGVAMDDLFLLSDDGVFDDEADEIAGGRTGEPLRDDLIILFAPPRR